MGYYLIAHIKKNFGLTQATKSGYWKEAGGRDYIVADNNDDAVEILQQTIDRYRGYGGSHAIFMFRLMPQIECTYNPGGHFLQEKWKKWVKTMASKLALDAGPVTTNDAKPATAAEAAKELRQILRTLVEYDHPTAKLGKPTYVAYADRWNDLRKQTNAKKMMLVEEIPHRRAAASMTKLDDLSFSISKHHLLVSEMLTRIRQLEQGQAQTTPNSELIQRAHLLVQCLPTTELPQGAAENTLRAIVAILRAHNYSVADIVPKDGALGDDSAVQAVVKELAFASLPDPVVHHVSGEFLVGDRVIVNYNRAAREAAGFSDHVPHEVIDNQPGEIVQKAGSDSDIPFRVKFDNGIYSSWWLPLESLRHEWEVIEEEVEEQAEEESVSF